MVNRTLEIWGVTDALTMSSLQYSKEMVNIILDDKFVTS